MPKQRVLSGKDVARILQKFGFEVHSQKGCHLHLIGISETRQIKVTIPMHGSQTLKPGTLRDIFDRAITIIPEKELRPFFFAD